MSEEKKEKEQKNSGIYYEVIDFLKDLAIIIVAVVIIRTFVAMPFQISGQSMYESYYDREFIIVDRFTYLFSSPNRWDVVVFKPNVNEDKKYFLKRIIGIPWDTLRISDWNVYIKPAWKDEYYKLEENYLSDENNWYTFVWLHNNTKIYELWPDEYFVMGDNRNHSTDSRECFSNCIGRTEFVPKSDIVWKVFIDLWYFNIKKFSFIQPDLWINTTPRFFKSPSKYNYGF